MADLQTRITNTGLTPANQKAVLVQLIQALFSDASLIRDVDLKGYIYATDASDTKIRIGPAGLVDFKNLEQKPAVAVDWKGSTLKSFTFRDGRIKVSADFDTEYRSTWIFSKFLIMCRANEQREAENLASEISLQLRDNTAVIKKNYDFIQFEVAQLSPGEPQGKNDWTVLIPLNTVAEHESYIVLSDLPSRLSDSYQIG